MIEYAAMSEAPDKPAWPLLMPPWPGYWRSKTAIERLTRFKNLIIHHQRWAPEMQSVQPLSKLFLGEDLKEATVEAFQRIEEEIRQNLMVVVRTLHEAGILSQSRVSHHDPIQNREITRTYDLVLDYFVLSDSDDRQNAYDALLERLDMAIGMYKARLPRAKRELFSPITWMAHVVRLPITILERAGLAAHPQSQEMILSGYGKLLKALIVAILLLIAIRLGVAIPWKDIVEGIFDLLK